MILLKWKKKIIQENNMDNKVKRVINSSKGKFMTVTFVKKDGTLRSMLCRTGVRKFVKGTDKRQKTNDNIQVVYDMHKKAYRSFNTDRVVSIKFNGETQYKLDINDWI